MTPEGKEFTRKEWLPALRSGEWRQGKNKLNDGDGRFCCLGVACELLKDQLLLRVQTDPCGVRYNSALSWLPSQVATFLGISDVGAFQEGEFGGGETLANLNDRGKTFPEIADIIEAQFLGEEV